MKILVLFLMLSVAMGTVGFLVGRSFIPPTSQDLSEADANDILFKLPLGRFTVQLLKPSKITNIRFNMDVFIVGAANFERMNGGLERNQMREDIIRLYSNLVETRLWIEDESATSIDGQRLADLLLKRLIIHYPMIRSVSITDVAANLVDRKNAN